MAIYMWRDVQEREPTSDTYTYLPLTATDQITNYGTSWEFRSVHSTTLSFWVYDGVDCLRLNNNGTVYKETFRDGSFTALLRIRPSSTSAGYCFGVSDIRVRINNGSLVVTSINTSGSFVTTTVASNLSASVRYLIIITYEKTATTGNWTLVCDIKGASVDTQQTAVQRNSSRSSNMCVGNYVSSTSGFFWLVSSFIIEDKVWTEQDKNNYYITTKWNYWL